MQPLWHPSRLSEIPCIQLQEGNVATHHKVTAQRSLTAVQHLLIRRNALRLHGTLFEHRTRTLNGLKEEKSELVQVSAEEER